MNNQSFQDRTLRVQPLRDGVADVKPSGFGAFGVKSCGLGSGGVKIYTDGACRGNPGPGGWGAIIVWKQWDRQQGCWNNKKEKISGYEHSTTNNRMELMAAIESISVLPNLLGSGPSVPSLMDSRPLVPTLIGSAMPDPSGSLPDPSGSGPLGPSIFQPLRDRRFQRQSYELRELRGQPQRLQHQRCRTLCVQMYTDSLYLKNGITVWINKWKNNNWMTSNNKPVKNRDLWMRLYDLSLRDHASSLTSATPISEGLTRSTSVFEFTWNWVKGHSGTNSATPNSSKPEVPTSTISDCLTSFGSDADLNNEADLLARSAINSTYM